MDEYNQYNMDPWEQDSYKTGSTNPPKKRGGLIAGLCVAVILLLGVISALSVMNIRLFHKLQGKGQHSMSFLEGGAAENNGQFGNNVNPSAPDNNDVTIELKPTPEGVENISQQQKPIRFLCPKGLHQLAAPECGAVNIRRNHQLHQKILPI